MCTDKCIWDQALQTSLVTAADSVNQGRQSARAEGHLATASAVVTQPAAGSVLSSQAMSADLPFALPA